MHKDRRQHGEGRQRHAGRILIADDDPTMRTLLAIRLEHEGFSVVGQADSGVKALRQAQTCTPSLVLLDLDMPVMEGLSTLRQLRKNHPQLPVLVFSMLDASLYSYRCIQLGAQGFISKNGGISLLLNAISQIAQGQMLFPRQSMAAAAGDLSNGEIVALRCLVRGGDVQSIASALMITPSDVDKLNHRLMLKLGLSRPKELIRYGRSLALN